jgi:hypothetical protein
MPIYKEDENRNILQVSGTANPVYLKVDCQYGTFAEVTFDHNGLKTAGCGEEISIGPASELKGLKITFNGSSGNPEGGRIRIIHTFYEKGGLPLVYIFPDDYTGTPPFDENDKEPSYKFYVKYT